MTDSYDLILVLLPVISFGMPLVSALVLGFGFPLLIVGVAALTRNITPSTRLALILSLIVLGSTLSVALSGRSLYSDIEYYRNPLLKLQESYTIWSIRSTQLVTAVVLVLALAELFRWTTKHARMEGRASQVWLAVVAYNLISVGVSGVVGTFRDPQFKDLYMIIVMTAATLLAKGCDAAMWRKLRLAFLLPSVGSLLAMIFMPRLALLPEYTSVLPGFHQRLFGLADHANSLGVVAAAGLMIELCPLVRARPSLIFLSIHLIVLVLAQSKTAWAAAALCLLFVRWSWIKGSIFSGNKWRATVSLLVLGIAGVCVLVVAVGLAVSSDRFLYGLDQAGVYTLTGRTDIWRMTIEEFFRSPLTGYGPSLWDLQFRLERGLPGAGQAHNQFVQILGQAGVLGMIAMMVYLLTMFYFSMYGWGRSQGLGFVFLLLILVRCVSESPLRMSGVMGWENLLHMIAFVTAAGGATEYSRSSDSSSAVDADLRPVVSST